MSNSEYNVLSYYVVNVLHALIRPGTRLFVAIVSIHNTRDSILAKIFCAILKNVLHTGQ